MSRSRKKHPAGGLTKAETDKPWKRGNNRRLRRIARCRVSSGDDAPALREVSNVCLSEKDGKGYWRHPAAKDWRK